MHTRSVSVKPPWLGIDEFCDPELCRLLFEETRNHAVEAATVSVLGRVSVVRHLRCASWTAIGSDLRRRVVSMLEEQLPLFSTHFGLQLTRIQEPHLIRYTVGDFHGLHIDSNADPTDPLQSKITCLVFLNSQKIAGHYDTADVFEGGELVLLDETQTNSQATVVHPVRRAMVAFSSSTPHEVLPVRRGERHVLATWYY